MRADAAGVKHARQLDRGYTGCKDSLPRGESISYNSDKNGIPAAPGLSPGLARFANRASALIAVPVLGMLLSAAAAYWTAARVERDVRMKFDSVLSDAQTAIESRLRAHANVLLGVRGLFIASDAVTRIDFRDYIYNLDLSQNFAGIEAISYARHIVAGEKAGFETEMRKDISVDPLAYPDFAVKPAGDRPEYVVVQYLEPMVGRERALGLDLAGDPVRLAALERARDSGQITATGRIKLILDAGGRSGFAMRLPVYQKGMPLVNTAQRRAAFRGIVATVVMSDKLFQEVLSQSFLQTIRLRVHDAGFLAGPEALQAPSAENLLFDSDSLLELGETERADAAVSTGLTRMSSLDLGGRRWYLDYHARGEFLSFFDRWLPWAVLLGGTIITLLLFSLMHSLASVGRRALALAASITADLRRSEANLAETQRNTQELIEALPIPVFFKGIDGRYLGVNRAWERFFGVVRTAFLGKTVGDLYPNNPEIAQRLYEQDQVLWEHPGTQEYETSITTPDGKQHNAIYYKATLTQTDGGVSGLVGTIVDITQRKQAEQRQALEHAVTRLLSESTTPDEVMPKIIQTICEALEFACGARMLLDENAQVMRRRESWSLPSAEIAEFIEQGRPPMYPDRTPGGLLRRAWASGEPVWIEDVTEDESFERAPRAAKAGLHAGLAFPILLGNEILGVMEFFSCKRRASDAELLRSMRSVGEQIGQFMARRQAEERVHHLAHYDELTGLPNRSTFSQRLSHALAQARRNSKSLAVLFIDLDRFKNINDTLGHEAGDNVLVEIAQRLQGCLREGDTVGRLGGDEFVVLIEALPEPMQVAAVAQKILGAAIKPFVIESQEFHLSASIGISTYPDDSEDMQGLLKSADIAMYRAKEQGRNNYQFYSALMNIHTVERLALESDLRRALERGEFLLHYQPKIDIASGRVTGMEALLRWQRPGHGLVAPMQFIPLAEETGLIVPIGAWVLKTACARNKAWQDQGLPPLRVAVNLSVRQFAHESLLQDVGQVLAETGLDPAGLELDITESMVMHDPEHAVKLLGSLKQMGIHISMDDFGTGYSSLAYLKRFPIDSLKIDRSFMRDIPGDSDGAAIAHAIIAMARSLRLKVIAEGVEREEQLHFLREHECDEMQGYLFSKPLPEEAFQSLFQEGAVGVPAAVK
ncbi:MAG: EAL domain-containing protein [Pseudomonadota bacterium]